jgi:hypothetical protein
MNHPLIALALADVRRDEMTALARRCRTPRTPLRARLAGAFRPRAPEPVSTTEHEGFGQARSPKVAG